VFEKSQPNAEANNLQKLIIQDKYVPAKGNAPYSILEGSIKKDVLTLIVQYGGGCKEHFFELYSNGLFLKKIPPRLNLFLEHKPNEDFCRKLVVDTLTFDLLNGRFPNKEKGYEIEIEIDSYSNILHYKY
jgi:hypothetical protein